MPTVYKYKANYAPIEMRISVLMHALTTNSFPQNMIVRLVLNLLKSRDTTAVLQWFITFDAFLL